jgi:beta-lactam-binding protein with PASTA domain
MPNEVGKNAADASDELTKLHFTVTVASKPSSADQANKVIEQNVAKDTKVDPATTKVALTVGAPMLRVPAVIGLSYGEAQIRLSQAQFHNVQAENQPVQNVNPGFVSAQAPEPGTEAQADAVVRLTVAAQLITVPQVTGMSFGNAVFVLKRAGLDYGVVRGWQVDGTVEVQSPVVNATVPLGTKVDLTLPGCRPPAMCIVYNRPLAEAALARSSVYMNNLKVAQPMMQPKLFK